MGAGAAVSAVQLGPLDSLSCEQLGAAVASIGTAYEGYSASIVAEGITGGFLSQLSDAEIAETLNDLGITKPLHVKNIVFQINTLKAKTTHIGTLHHSSSAPGVLMVTNAIGVVDKVAKVVHELDLPSRVSVTPRKLMTDLFAIQGIALDPSDLDPAIDKIAATVGNSNGVCDGEKSYDLFINYRVAADADVAEKLYLYLKTKGIHAFLDKKCLKAGEPWKEGFLSGLSRSRMFLCLISSAALTNVRDKSKDHALDNVLLEYETALLIQRHLFEVDADLARNYVVPVHVGHFSQGVLTKFTDFNSMMYPDNVGPVLDNVGGVDVVASTTPTVPVVDLMTCEGAVAALQMQPSLGPAFVEAALKAIGNLCRLDKENATALDKLGACEVVVKVLLEYATTNAFVAAQGCYALHSLSKDGKDREDKLVAAGAGEAAITALRTFSTNADVGLNGCWAIRNFTGTENTRCKLVALGAIEDLVKALQAFPANSEIVKHCCVAIYNFSTTSADRKKKLLAAGVKPLVEAAFNNGALTQIAHDEAKDALRVLSS